MKKSNRKEKEKKSIDQRLKKSKRKEKKKRGSENVVVDHLSRLKNEEVTKEEPEVNGEFPDEFLLQVTARPWFADMAHWC